MRIFIDQNEKCADNLPSDVDFFKLPSEEPLALKKARLEKDYEAHYEAVLSHLKPFIDAGYNEIVCDSDYVDALSDGRCFFCDGSFRKVAEHYPQVKLVTCDCAPRKAGIPTFSEYFYGN